MAKDVVGWVLQNLWALIVCIRELLYMYKKVIIITHRNIIQFCKYHKTPQIPIMLKVMNTNSLSYCSLLGCRNHSTQYWFLR